MSGRGVSKGGGGKKGYRTKATQLEAVVRDKFNSLAKLQVGSAQSMGRSSGKKGAKGGAGKKSLPDKAKQMEGVVRDKVKSIAKLQVGFAYHLRGFAKSLAGRILGGNLVNSHCMAPLPATAASHSQVGWVFYPVHCRVHLAGFFTQCTAEFTPNTASRMFEFCPEPCAQKTSCQETSC